MVTLDIGNIEEVSMLEIQNRKKCYLWEHTAGLTTAPVQNSHQESLVFSIYSITGGKCLM